VSPATNWCTDPSISIELKPGSFLYPSWFINCRILPTSFHLLDEPRPCKDVHHATVVLDPRPDPILTCHRGEVPPAFVHQPAVVARAQHGDERDGVGRDVLGPRHPAEQHQRLADAAVVGEREDYMAFQGPRSRTGIRSNTCRASAIAPHLPYRSTCELLDTAAAPPGSRSSKACAYKPSESAPC
jgi:hypothetical protein